MKSSVNYTPSKILFYDCSNEIILIVCNKIHVKMSLKPNYEFPPFCGNSIIKSLLLLVLLLLLLLFYYYCYYYYYCPEADPG